LDANYTFLADIVKELTGDWVKPLECKRIQALDRVYHDEVVFFGELEKAQALEEVSMLDRYQFDEGRVGFFHNNDEACRKKHGVPAEGEFAVFYNGENSLPYVLKYDETMDVRRLMFETNVRAVNGTPKWG